MISKPAYTLLIILFLMLSGSRESFANIQKGKVRAENPAKPDTVKQSNFKKSADQGTKDRPDPEWMKKHPFYFDPRTKACPFYFARREGC